MTYAPPMPSPLWALSANMLLPRRSASPGPVKARHLSQPRVTVSRTTSPVEFQQPDGWLQSASRRLGELASLEFGWDDSSAQPISPSLIDMAWSFLSSELLSSLEVPPDIVPTFGSGLLLEWHTTEVDLIIELDPETPGSFYFCDNETGGEVEAAIVDNLDAIATAFIKLGVQV
jgi:hypothetical protein